VQAQISSKSRRIQGKFVPVLATFISLSEKQVQVLVTIISIQEYKRQYLHPQQINQISKCRRLINSVIISALSDMASSLSLIIKIDRQYYASTKRC